MKKLTLTHLILLSSLWLSGCVTMELSDEDDDDDEDLDRHEHLEEQEEEMLRQENEQLELIDYEELS